MAIRVQFLADVIDYLRGSGQVKDATKDNADGLEDLMRKAIQLGREIGKTTDEIALDLSRGFDVPLARAKRAVEEVGDEAKTTGDKVDKSISDGSGRAGEAVSELGSIARDILQGDFDSAAQGAVGSLLKIAGVAGAGGVIADAVGWLAEFVTDQFRKITEAQDQARDAAYGFAYGVAGALEAAGYSERLSQWTGDADKFKQAQDLAKISGEDLTTVLDALVSGGPKLSELADAFERNAMSSDIMLGRVAELEGVLKGTAEGYAMGAAGAEANAAALYNFAIQVGKATGEVDDLGNKIVEMPDGKQVVIDAETKKAYTDIDAFEQKKISDKQMSVKAVLDDASVAGYQPQTKYLRVVARLEANQSVQQLLGGSRIASSW